MSRYRFISAHRAVYGVQRLCRVLDVARSGFYAWVAGAGARAGRAAADAALTAQARAIHAASGGTYGSPRITAELHAQGVRANHKRVERLMRQAEIVGAHLRRRRRTTIPDPAAEAAPDLLGRDFGADRANVKWAGDITYLRVADRWWYLATVIDLHSRRLIGYRLADHARAELVGGALHAAVGVRGGSVEGVIFHSDHGSQYTSGAFAKLCADLKVTQSMGTIGDSLDNAVAESFFATLKRELGARFDSPEHARAAVLSWVAFYNHRRRHSTLGYHSPADYERITAHQQPAA